MKTVY